MFSKNERLIIDVLAPGNRLHAGAISAETGLAKSSVHSALRSLITQGVVLEETADGRPLFQLASKDEIELAGRRVLDDFLNTFSKTQWSATDRPRLVFTDQYVLPDEMLQQLRQRYDVVTYDESPKYLDDELFWLRSKDANVVVRFDKPNVNDDYLRAFPQLQAIVCPAIHHDNIDLDACNRFDVKVVNFDPETQRYNIRAHLEYVVQSALALLRPLTRIAYNTTRTGEFHFANYVGPDIGGSRVGFVIGATNIRRYVEVFQALECEVRIASLLQAPSPPVVHGIRGYTNMHDLWQTCDMVIFMDDVRVELDPLFEMTSIPKYLIFTSEAAQYSYDVLRQALVSGRLKGVAIDYLQSMFVERAFDQNLQHSLKSIVNLPNVMITPEMCAISDGSLALSHRYAFDTLMKLELP